MYLINEGLKIIHKEGFRSFIKKASYYLYTNYIAYIFSPFIIYQYKNSIRNIDGIHDALDFAFSFRSLGVSIKPMQIKYEITKLLDIVANLKPKVILEIGTANGGTLFLFTRVASPDAKIISIDLPGGRFGVDILSIRLTSISNLLCKEEFTY
jgi:hypothetical protein